MSDDRRAQAGAEAYLHRKRFGRSADYGMGFIDGVEWADANPYSTPEALVAAYEDGQRDAVSKGLAKMRITRRHLSDVAMMTAHTGQDEIEAMLPGLLGIEVRDE